MAFCGSNLNFPWGKIPLGQWSMGHCRYTPHYAYTHTMHTQAHRHMHAHTHTHMYTTHPTTPVCCVLQASEAQPASIFTGEEELFAFDRTVSRLKEMQTQEYWNTERDDESWWWLSLSNQKTSLDHRMFSQLLNICQHFPHTCEHMHILLIMAVLLLSFDLLLLFFGGREGGSRRAWGGGCKDCLSLAAIRIIVPVLRYILWQFMVESKITGEPRMIKREVSALTRLNLTWFQTQVIFQQQHKVFWIEFFRLKPRIVFFFCQIVIDVVSSSIPRIRTHTHTLETHTADNRRTLGSKLSITPWRPQHGSSTRREGKGHHSLKGKLLLALELPNTTLPPFPQTLS